MAYTAALNTDIFTDRVVNYLLAGDLRHTTLSLGQLRRFIGRLVGICPLDDTLGGEETIDKVLELPSGKPLATFQDVTETPFFVITEIGELREFVVERCGPNAFYIWSITLRSVIDNYNAVAESPWDAPVVNDDDWYIWPGPAFNEARPEPCFIDELDPDPYVYDRQGSLVYLDDPAWDDRYHSGPAVEPHPGLIVNGQPYYGEELFDGELEWDDLLPWRRPPETTVPVHGRTGLGLRRGLSKRLDWCRRDRRVHEGHGWRGRKPRM